MPHIENYTAAGTPSHVSQCTEQHRTLFTENIGGGIRICCGGIRVYVEAYCFRRRQTNILGRIPNVASILTTIIISMANPVWP